jgi:hypothetical protein
MPNARKYLVSLGTENVFFAYTYRRRFQYARPRDNDRFTLTDLEHGVQGEVDSKALTTREHPEGVEANG